MLLKKFFESFINRNRSQRRNAAQHAARAKLQFEPLESRELLSADGCLVAQDLACSAESPACVATLATDDYVVNFTCDGEEESLTSSNELFYENMADDLFESLGDETSSESCSNSLNFDDSVDDGAIFPLSFGASEEASNSVDALDVGASSNSLTTISSSEDESSTASSSSGGSSSGGSSSGGSSSDGSSSGGSSSGGSSSGGSSSGGSSSGGSSSGGSSSGGSSSGGSSSGGSSSGGSDVVVVNTILNRTSTCYYYEGETIRISYNNLPAGYSLSASIINNDGVLIENSSDCILNSTGSGSGSIVIPTLDDYRRGGDKSLTVNLSLSGGDQAVLSTSSYTLTVIEKPEFISFAERNSEVVAYDDDSYRAYVREDASSGATAAFFGGWFSVKGSSNIRYSLVNSSPYFDINEETGQITITANAPDIVAQTNSYIFDLQVRAYDSRMTSDVSGGIVVSDDAYVTLSIASWNVVRNGQEKANAVPRDGCTIEGLAQEIGLNKFEFANWLTINAEVQVPLFNGEYCSVHELRDDSVLAAGVSNVFMVPNTIFSCWGWNPQQKNLMHWNENNSHLRILGFNVVTYDNSACTLDRVTAKNNFMNALHCLSLSKTLHGMYLTMHGSENGVEFGSAGSSWGPIWSVKYRTSTTYDYNAPDDWAISHALNYRLGAFVSHTCYSANGLARSLVNDTGIHYLFSHITNSSEACAFASLWNWVQNYDGTYTFGGKQKTNYAQYITLAPNWLPVS